MTTFSTDYSVDFSDRVPAPGVDPLFFQRWSPRAFKKTEIPTETLETIFDAARWSPSCFNEQPWLFITSSGADDFDTFLGLLMEKNQAWAKNASLIGFIFAKKTFSHNATDNRFAAFDCGAAWMALTLQAAKFGLYTHGMGGIKRDSVASVLKVSDLEYEIVCGFALGAIASPDILDEDTQSREKPSTRKSLLSIWQPGILAD